MTEQRSVTDALGVSNSLANVYEAEGHMGAHLDFPGPCYCQHVVQALPHTAHHCSLLTVEKFMLYFAPVEVHCTFKLQGSEKAHWPPGMGWASP